MKANELRIGNLVLEKRKCKISGIGGMPDKDTILDVYRSVNGVYDNYVIFDDFPTTMPIEVLSPILLTEELLLKCGGKLFPNGFGSKKIVFDLNIRIGFSIEFVTDREGDVVIGAILNGKSTLIKFLHQLQNLYFCLCGQELNIEL